MKMIKASNIDEFIDQCEIGIRPTMLTLRKKIKDLLPAEAEEAMKYGIPTFQLNGKNMLHFSAYEKHIGFYPTPAVIEQFKKELSKYKTSKGAIQFPIDEPLPYPLITKMVKARLQLAAKPKKAAPKKK